MRGHQRRLDGAHPEHHSGVARTRGVGDTSTNTSPDLVAITSADASGRNVAAIAPVIRAHHVTPSPTAPVASNNLQPTVGCQIAAWAASVSAAPRSSVGSSAGAGGGSTYGIPVAISTRPVVGPWPSSVVSKIVAHTYAADPGYGEALGKAVGVDLAKAKAIAAKLDDRAGAGSKR